MSKTCEIQASVPSGFEPTAQMEASEKLGVDARYERGKITFIIPVADVSKISQLQSVDNLYVILKKYKKFEFKQAAEEALLQITKIIPEIDWATGIEVWGKFFDAEHNPSADPILGWEERMKTVTKQTVDKYANMGNKRSQQNKKKDKFKKFRKSKPETNGDSNEAKTEEQTASAAPQTETPDNRKEIPSNELDSTDAPPAKKQRIDDRPGVPSFRATCWRAGQGHSFQSPQAAAVFGGAIQDYFQWNVHMKDFDVEVVLDIVDDNINVGIALTRGSMHRRHITHFGPTTLRPTIAYGMLRLCKIQDNDVVCDPMCGGGSIPIEGALNWPAAKHICGDYDERAVPRAQSNILALNQQPLKSQRKQIEIDVMRWDATQLPLKDQHVDVFVSDMPFGKRSGSKMRNWHLYPKSLTDMARVAKLGTGRAALLTQDRKCMVKCLSSTRIFWTLISTVSVNIGGLSAGVYILNRTFEKFTAEKAQNIFQNMQKTSGDKKTDNKEDDD